VKERNFQVVLVDSSNPVALDNTPKEMKTVHYNGAKTTISLK